MILSAMRSLRASLTRTTVSTIASGASASLRGAHQRAAVLGKARAAKARPGMQKLAADAAVEADALGHVLDIGADPLAQIGDLVDERDLGREKGVGRVFDQFRGLDVGEQHRRFEQIERTVERPHHRAGALAVGADHHPVGAHEILDRRAFAQKFGVGGDVEPAWRPHPPQDLGNLAPGADRHRRLGDDDGIIGQRPPDLLGRGKDIREVGMAVAAPRRRADGDEHGLGPGDRGAADRS